VVFDRNAYQLSEKLFYSVASYIDDHYVALWEEAVYGVESEKQQQTLRRRSDLDLHKQSSTCAQSLPCAPAAAPKAASLEDMLKQTDAGFSETLLKLIDKTGKKDSVIYKKANLTKQHFSKIRNNPEYKPTKTTALALAIALELDLAQTKDLIGRAGYALTNSSKFDLIIRYFIEQGNYDVIEINTALYEFDQSLLGA